MIWIKSFDPYGQPYGVTEIVDFMNVEDYALDNPSATVYPAEMTRIPTYNFPHTVTFDANGGSGSMSSQTTSVATALTNNAFARTGYVFTGWNTAADGSGAAYADGATYLFDADVTLYAQWLANPLTLTATSISSTGWVLESGYNTNVGGSHATVADSLYVGDSNGNAQFKDVIQFDTSVIPDNAVIDSWYIKFYTNSISGSVSGWGPAAHPNAITIASASTCFNSNCTLENADWQATGTSWYDYMNVVTNNPGWNQSNTFTNVTAIRKTGVTEFRINWVTKTDSDSSADRVNLAGPSSGNKPVLIITYHLP